MPKGKEYQAMVEERKEKIYAFEIMGMPRKLMLKYAMETWGIRVSTVSAYRREVQKQIAEDFQEHKQKALERSLALRRYMIFECLQENDIEQAFKILADTDKMLGLYEPEVQRNLNINFNADNVDLDRLSEAQLKRLADGESPQTALQTESDD